MAKNLKLKIKNTQLAKAAGLDKLKAKLSGGKPKAKKSKKEKVEEKAPEPQESKPKSTVRAKSKSSFAPTPLEEEVVVTPAAEPEIIETPPEPAREEVVTPEEAIEKIVPQEPAPIIEPEPEPKAAAPVKKDEKKPSATLTTPARVKLGPTGRHIKDLLPPKKVSKPPASGTSVTKKTTQPAKSQASKEPSKEERKGKKVRGFRDFKPVGKMKSFDSRGRQGRGQGDDERWRKRRQPRQAKIYTEEQIVRPSSLQVRLPITIKDLATEMKFKASELISKLFMQGVIMTLNDILDDETTIQLLGHEFGCEITIDTSEEERIQITSKSIQEEIAEAEADQLQTRPCVVTFMGHVDHGKTSLIDTIRETNRVAGEAGAITQHMGAFRCQTKVGEITILDTPGHEAFSSMRARGAQVTDIVVLVIAGDEGVKEQTKEAIQHAQAAKVPLVVAINKCDKPNFNAENVYRELSEVELLPEAWGGQTITINTSATTKEGVNELLEMLALQAEILELRANPDARARGTVIEAELHKGLGCVATILVQNGTLKLGDSVVFDQLWGKIKTMHDEHGANLIEAGPSIPVEITGLSGLPSAGNPFIVVKDEKEARTIAEARIAGTKHSALQKKKMPSLENLMQEDKMGKKVLNLILRGDVQGSIEALKSSIQGITSEKAEADVIFTGVGEISESDIQLAAASNAVIIGFHTKVESHAEGLIKELGVQVRLFNVIYHAVDEVKAMMLGLLDKIKEEKDTGKALIQAVFKSSQLGYICGCIVTEGLIHRNHHIRVVREGETVWTGKIASIKRVKDDVKEVKKGVECGILLDGYSQVQENDIIEAFEIIYKDQEL